MIKRRYFYSYMAFSKEGRPIALGEGVLTVTSWLQADSLKIKGMVENKAKAENPLTVNVTLLAFNRI